MLVGICHLTLQSQLQRQSLGICCLTLQRQLQRQLRLFQRQRQINTNIINDNINININLKAAAAFAVVPAVPLAAAAAVAVVPAVPSAAAAAVAVVPAVPPAAPAAAVAVVPAQAPGALAILPWDDEVHGPLFHKVGDRSVREHRQLSRLMHAGKKVSRTETQLMVATADHLGDGDPDEDLQWVVDLAYDDKSRTVSTGSLAHKQSRPTVRCGHMATAYAWLQATREHLNGVRADITAHGKRLAIFLEKLKWDESSQVLVLDILADRILRDAARSSWHIMLQHRELWWRIDGEEVVQRVVIAMPPSVLVGAVDSDCFYDALFCTTFARFVTDFVNFMSSVADMAFKARESDDDSKNKRLMAFEVQRAVAAGEFHTSSACTKITCSWAMRRSTLASTPSRACVRTRSSPGPEPVGHAAC